MEYLIFIAIVLFVLWGYHRIKYYRSYYSRFEYYLLNKFDEPMVGLIILFELLLVITIIGLFIYFGGFIIKNL